jgi:hypothetical protein
MGGRFIIYLSPSFGKDVGEDRGGKIDKEIKKKCSSGSKMWDSK